MENVYLPSNKLGDSIPIFEIKTSAANVNDAPRRNPRHAGINAYWPLAP